MAHTPPLREINEVDTLPISPEEWWGIVADLESQAASPADERRSDERHPMKRLARLSMVRLQHPDGDIETFRVRLRNFSAGGVSFLHGQTVYRGTPCVLALMDNSGEGVIVSGHFVRSSLVQKGVYEVGIQFDEKVEVPQFINESNH